MMASYTVVEPPARYRAWCDVCDWKGPWRLEGFAGREGAHHDGMRHLDGAHPIIMKESPDA